MPRKPNRSEDALSFSATNWGLLIAGIAAIAVGYVLLGAGSTVAAPLILVLGYMVLLPAALIL